MSAVIDGIPYEKSSFLLMSRVEVYYETIVETLVACAPHFTPSMKEEQRVKIEIANVKHS